MSADQKSDDSLIRPALNPAYTFDSLVDYPGNNEALIAARKAASSPGQGYNPLFIYGHAGLGKTHLLHAIGNEALLSNPSLSILYVTYEDMTDDILEALRLDKVTDLQERYRNSDLLLLDDIQFISDRAQTQQKIYFIFDALHNAGKQIVLASSKAPAELGDFIEGFKSRFGMGYVIEIKPPQLEDRVEIISIKARQRKIEITPEAVCFIASKVPADVRMIEGVLIRLAVFAAETGEQISMKIAEQIHCEQ